MAYSDFLTRTESGQTITIPVEELLRIMLSGEMPDGTTVSAKNSHIGQVGGVMTIVDVELTLDTNAYADGDVLAEVQEVQNALRTSGGSGLLQSVIVVDKSDQGEAMDVYLFDSDASLGTENAAVSISDADAAKIIGKVAIGASDYNDLGGVQVAASTNQQNLALPLKVSTGKSIYLGVVSRGTGTYAADGVVIRLGIIQD